MLNKLGLSAAMLFATVAFGQTTAMAANWNNHEANGHYDARDDARDNHRDNRNDRDFRHENHYVAPVVRERFVRREPVYVQRPALRFIFGFGSRNAFYR